jgi:hypothetical protein
MVSVLPAHIALEMKTEMLRKTRKAQMKSMLVTDESIMLQEKNRFINVRGIYQYPIYTNPVAI